MDEKKYVCVAGLLMTYDENTGNFELDTEVLQNATLALYLKGVVAAARYFNVIEKLTEQRIGNNKIVDVPCNIEWRNVHQIDPNTGKHVGYFIDRSAASLKFTAVLFEKRCCI